jgi:serine/threonine-protein kinase
VEDEAVIIDGRYELLRQLGQGGMGTVHEARHLGTGRLVALKLILDDARRGPGEPEALRRFQREARAAGSIESRHVVSVLDTGIDVSRGSHFIVMELLAGEDLKSLIRRLGALEPDLVLRIAAQVCLGLHSAHERGIVHRDIKSANIFLARSDAAEIEAKILDFGIAKLRADPLASRDAHDLTRSGAMLGSPLYMSPEQATGSRNVDRRSDIWSLGVVMYEALTGSTPHGPQSLGSLILSICSNPARPVRVLAPHVTDEIAAVVHKALALEPGQRFETAETMRRAIAGLLAGRSTIHETMLVASSTPVPVRRDPVSASMGDTSPSSVGLASDGSMAIELGATTTQAATLESSRSRRRWTRLLSIGAPGLLAVVVAAALHSLARPAPEVDSKPIPKAANLASPERPSTKEKRLDPPPASGPASASRPFEPQAPPMPSARPKRDTSAATSGSGPRPRNKVTTSRTAHGPASAAAPIPAKSIDAEPDSTKTLPGPLQEPAIDRHFN